MSALFFNPGCQPYREIFSPRRNAQVIQNSAFERSKRQPPLKCHDTSPWLQKGSRCPVVHQGEVIGSRNKLSQERLDYYSTPQGIVELNGEGISLAVERRVALFFQQAILCFGMSSFIFSAGGADGQIGTSPPIRFSSLDGKHITHKREAAHSSTLPTLIAHAKDGSTPNGFIYLKGGSSYAQHNATIGMHECVNGADELIDGKGQENRLRKIAVSILNCTAEGLDPVQATQKFIQSFKDQVDSESKKLQEGDQRKFILQEYRQRIGEVQIEAEEQEFYDRLIGVIVSAEGPERKTLREVIYKKRYDIIRLQEITESTIGKLIEEMKKKMGSRDRSLLEYLLLKGFSETEERQILEKLFGKTAAFFEKGIVDPKIALKRFNTRISNLQTKYAKELSSLKRDLRAKFHELSCAEFTYRSGLFKDLRTKVKYWTQQDFRENYRKTTGHKVSQAWVSRMEQLSRIPVRGPDSYKTPINQRRRYVTVKDAMRCAQTFGIDAGAFLPCLFTSSYGAA